MNEDCIIAGVGNILFCDEGMGIHLLKALQASSDLGDPLFLDLGTSTVDLAYYVNQHTRKLVIIDTIHAEEEKPGTLFKLSATDLVQKASMNEISLHQLGVINALRLHLVCNDLPDTLILGVVPADIHSFSTRMSEIMQKQFPELLEKVKNCILEFLKY